MEKIFNSVENFKKKYINLWWQSDSGFPCFLNKYSHEERKVKEHILNSSVKKLFSLMENIPIDDSKRAVWQQKLSCLIKEEAKEHLNITNSELKNNLTDGFMEVTNTFILTVKSFDPDFKAQDIMQAMRNVWIMNLIQVLSGRKIQHTPSIFAYSMLYPYTDNYLDRLDIPYSQKKKFNKRLEARLEGFPVTPFSSHEQKVYKLLDMIENQYERELFPSVYQSIISIHRGQCKSLLQQNGLSSPYEKDIMSISAEKGGTSVLADAYLVCGDIEDELADLMFGFGFVLQLIDDLQDAKDDLDNLHMTVFSQTARSWKLDAITNKLVAFTHNALDFKNCCSFPIALELKELILRNSMLLIFEAISKNRNLYTQDYIDKIEEHSPISFAYFKKLNKKTSKKLSSLKKRYGNISLEDFLGNAEIYKNPVAT